MLCVRPGVLDVLANPFRCSSELISDDFPTLDLPRNAISGKSPTGQCRRSKALFTNSADLTFICLNYTGLTHGGEKEGSIPQTESSRMFQFL